MSGLTTRQQWTHDHIQRCPGCGEWRLLTHRQLHGHAPAPCTHANPDALDHKAAA